MGKRCRYLRWNQPKPPCEVTGNHCITLSLWSYLTKRLQLIIIKVEIMSLSKFVSYDHGSQSDMGLCTVGFRCVPAPTPTWPTPHHSHVIRKHCFEWDKAKPGVRADKLRKSFNNFVMISHVLFLFVINQTVKVLWMCKKSSDLPWTRGGVPNKAGTWGCVQ